MLALLKVSCSPFEVSDAPTSHDHRMVMRLGAGSAKAAHASGVMIRAVRARCASARRQPGAGLPRWSYAVVFEGVRYGARLWL